MKRPKVSAKIPCSDQPSSLPLATRSSPLSLSASLSTRALLSVLITASGLGLCSGSATAQTAPNINYDSNTGAVQVNNNAFNIQTGVLENTSNIPLPAGLPTATRDGLAQPTNSQLMAPNSVELTPNVAYINQSLNVTTQA